MPARPAPTCRRNFQLRPLFRRSSNQLLPYDHSTTSRFLSSSSNQEIHPSTIAALEFRVRELERLSQLQRLTKYDLQNLAWPLLSDCASLPFTPNENAYARRSGISTQQDLHERAKLCSRILEVCLKEVEGRRVFLWDWLQKSAESTSVMSDETTGKFSPTAFWNETPHPTKEMFSLVFSAWRHVVESCSSFSIKSTDAMILMESSARQASSLLSLMEDEYSSDSAFIHAYNSHVQKGSYTLLRMGAVLPDVRNYSEVIRTWAQCIDGSILRESNTFSRDGAFQKRLTLEATAMKSMMELLEAMEEDLYENFSPNVSQRKRPPPDRICYNIILASMARQINPSLYEMRLVLQRMMERVKYELERPENEGEDEAKAEHIYDYAMTFFPDVFSYNALIEARANRSAMFASDQQQLLRQQSDSQRSQHHSAWQQGNNGNLSHRKKRFTSSEEEALLAEQILDEMCHLSTVPVRPNIYSYNGT